MDDRNCRSISGTQFVEKNKEPCEEIISSLSRKQDLLDRPLSTFTAEDVREATEQLRTMLKALHTLPSETLQERIPSHEAIIQGLQKTIVELTLALDQLSPPENKASFYTHLLVSQQYFADVFTYDQAEANEHMCLNTNSEPATIINFSARPRSLLDFSQTILPGICTLIQNPGATCSTEYEQAVANLQTLDAVLEKQKNTLKISQYIDNNEYYTLRCRLSVILAYASELLRRLIHSLATLQTQSRSKSKRTAQLKEETLYSLTLFIHNFDDILQKTQKLNLLQHQERFQHQEREPASKKIISMHR